MFFPFILFLLHGTVTYADECPEEKRVGDICYTRVAMTETHQYGCMGNCTYKKTLGSDSGLYCFKKGSLQVTQCGETTNEIGYNPQVVCGSGNEAPYCNQCGTTEAECEGIGNPDSECILDNGTCVSRYNITCGNGMEMTFCAHCGKTSAECESLECVMEGEDLCGPRDIQFDIQLFMDSAEELLTEVETNSTAEIASLSSDSCGIISKSICLLNYGKVLKSCNKECNLGLQCWTSCLKENVCEIPIKCRPGGDCFNSILTQINKILEKMGISPVLIEILDQVIENINCLNKIYG